jgi:hypothetical protein
MALISCSECGGEFSDRAPACPKCGNPNHRAAAFTPTGTFAGGSAKGHCRSCGSPVDGTPRPCLSCGCQPLMPGPFCASCGGNVPVNAVMCVTCGAALSTPGPFGGAGQPPSKILCAVLAFVCPFGIHRFLMGHQDTGVAQLILSFFCIVGIFWSWVDGILILTGSLRMADGRELAP